MTEQDLRREIRHATAADAVATAELIAVAFHGLDVSAWLVPDPAARLRPLIDDFRIWVDHALTYGEIHLIDEVLEGNNRFPIAAAVWFPQLSGPTPPPEDYDARLAAACGPATPRFHVLDEMFADSHPESFPQHYLAYLATRPGWQSGGLGSTLLDHHHRRLDHDAVPAFLHASCARSRDLYARQGYECLGDPFRLPDGPPMWAMWREPAN